MIKPLKNIPKRISILEQVPPYQHAQRIEQYIRTINDRVRVALDTLVYELPPKLFGELTSSVVLKHNDLPTTKWTS